MKKNEQHTEEPEEEAIFYNEDDYDDQDSPNPSNTDDEFEEYGEDEDGDYDEGEHQKWRSPFLQFLKVLATPVMGWRYMKNCKMKSEAYAAGCFYPLIALASASVFSNIFYKGDSIGLCLKSAIVTFVCFFASYFLITAIASKSMPGESKKVFSGEFGKKFVMTLLGSLALFFTIYTVLQPIEVVLIFLPIYTVFLLFRGEKFLRIPKDRVTQAIFMMCFLIFGIPLCIYYIFLSVLLNG